MKTWMWLTIALAGCFSKPGCRDNISFEEDVRELIGSAAVCEYTHTARAVCVVDGKTYLCVTDGKDTACVPQTEGIR